MAQLVERSPSMQNVAGSNPARGNSFFSREKKGVVLSHTLWHARDGCFVTTLARLQQCGTFPGNNVTFVHSAKCYINDKYYGNSQEKLVTRNEK